MASVFLPSAPTVVRQTRLDRSAVTTRSNLDRPAVDRPSIVRPNADRPIADWLIQDRTAEEWCDWLPLGIGTVLSVVGAGALLGRLRATADWTLVLGCAVYASTLLAVHICSALSRHLERRRLKRAFRILDQGFLFLLIIGTYTPVAAKYLSGGSLSPLFWAMWCVALLGFLSKTVLQRRVDAGSTVAYVVLGWLPMLAAHSAWLQVPKAALVLLFLGALCYGIGLVFFLHNARGRYFRTAWRVLVMAGSALHFYAVILCVTAVTEAARGG
jgi:hemolysin III